jgi:4-hydroxy-tetrahydrodipicolinate reductase
VKVAIIGAGKMGKTIESLSSQMGFEVVERYNSHNPFLECSSTNADVAIEFSIPELAVKHIFHAHNLGLPIVVGTTGWYDEFDEVKQQTISKNGSLFYASNFSVGVNIFFQINALLAKLMDQQTPYSASMQEIHHTEKKDAPSGTAISLANQICANNHNYDKWTVHSNTSLEPNGELYIEALREPHLPGTHIVKWDSAIDFIEIKHEAKSRLGFAQGAVYAAKYLFGKKGVFSMNDLLKL